jgi:GT2 family glycosyltransferase
MSKKLKVGVAIPWRPQESRLSAFYFVLNFYQNYFPDFKIYASDCSDQMWNVAEARNRAVEQAIKDGCDVVVVSDADVIPKKKMLKRAIKLAHKNQLIVQPFYRAFELNKEMTNRYVRGVISKKKIRKKANLLERSPGGILVITPKVFKALNGWDQRFRGWGYEDVALSWVHACIMGYEYIRLDSEIYSLWHDDKDLSNLDKNEDRFKLIYREAINDLEKMKNLVLGNRI